MHSSSHGSFTFTGVQCLSLPRGLVVGGRDQGTTIRTLFYGMGALLEVRSTG